MSPSSREGEAADAARVDAARKRAAVETYARHEKALRRTARRYSICADDAEDALQRGLEILLTKAPSEDPRELIRWTQTVVKHEALAVRRDRERILAGPASARPEAGSEDWVALIPTDADGPPERAERREAVARSREALQTLKPQELRALTLLAEGYSYLEIAEMTGWSATKINRCLAEGRERFRQFLSRSEDGQRCVEMGPLISTFCDGEASARDATALREHLRACAHCRATLRAYRAAPAAAMALGPVLPLGRPLLDRVHETFAGLANRVGGGGSGGSDSALSQIAVAGGTRGAGMAALAKVAAICIGAVGGAAACVATGVVPAPIEFAADHTSAARIQHTVAPTVDDEPNREPGVTYEPAPEPTQQKEAPPADHESAAEPPPASTPSPEASSGAVEYSPPPPPTPASQPSSTGASSGAAGEFGP